jgi:hypothetical protein
MSTLKHAAVGVDGVLRWVWWAGNDALRGAPLPQKAPGPGGGPRTLLVDAAHGSVVEGELVWGGDAGTAIAFAAPSNRTAGGFLRLAAAAKVAPPCFNSTSATIPPAPIPPVPRARSSDLCRVRHPLVELKGVVQCAWSFPQPA